MNKSGTTFWLTPAGFAAIGLIAAVSYFLWMEHRQHMFQFLPFLIILLCPLMHLFMHRSHSHGDHSQAEHDAYQHGLEEGKKQAGRDDRR